MRKKTLSVLLLICVAALVFHLMPDRHESAIKAVKKIPRVQTVGRAGLMWAMNEAFTCEQWVNSIAGVTGEVRWSAFDDLELGDIIVVNTTIKPGRSESYSSIKIQFLFNVETERAELYYAEIDGEPTSMMALALL